MADIPNLNNMASNNYSKPNINPYDYPIVECECGNTTFEDAVILRRIPSLILGYGEGEQVVPAHRVLVCTKCGKILKDDLDLMQKEEEKYKKIKENNERTKSSTLIL